MHNPKTDEKIKYLAESIKFLIAERYHSKCDKKMKFTVKNYADEYSMKVVEVDSIKEAKIIAKQLNCDDIINEITNPNEQLYLEIDFETQK